MLSIEHCKRILEDEGDNYTNEEVKEIRELLYLLAEIEYSFVFKKE